MTDGVPGSTPHGSPTGAGSGRTPVPDGGERFCIACGKPIEPGVVECPECGARQDGESEPDDAGSRIGPDPGTDATDRGDERSSSGGGSGGGGSSSGVSEGAAERSSPTGGAEAGDSPTAAATNRPGQGEEYCPECGTVIDRTVATCPHCGADRSAPEKSPVIAGVLSLLLIGAGQVYIGRTKRGIALFGASLVSGALTLVTGVTAILSIGIWLYAGYDAYTKAKSG